MPTKASGHLVILETTHVSPGAKTGADAWEPPTEFDGYQLKACIGKGAMGRVYLAQDAVLDRPVAIKFIDMVEADWYRYERFLVEARAIARLQHPNVVAIYRIGEVRGYPYIASEFVRGDRLDEIPMPVPGERVLRIGLGLARGLAAAHRRGVVHRDIKPANVILSEGSEVKLLDFGLAKLVEGTDQSVLKQTGFPFLGRVPVPRAPRVQPDVSMEASGSFDPRAELTQELRLPSSKSEPSSDLTHDGAVIGTPGYMSPEVWEGEPASFRSDVYSVGAVLYRLCTGSPPYQGRTLDELRSAALAQEIKPITSFGNIDVRLATIIQRCLNRSPGLRYSSGEELREVLEALSPERRDVALPEGNPYRGLRAFEAEHRALFFGRDAEIRAILERLRSDPFVLVAGSSGVGKSSLCRAGVLPRVAEWGLGDERGFSIVSLTPGKRPVQTLAAALAPYWGADEEKLAKGFREDWRELYRELRRRQKERGPLLLFIDQLEELVTLADPADAEVMGQILEVFGSAAPGLRLLATVRGDFLVRVASLPGLSEDMARALYLLKPLSPDGIREAIVGPARAKGVVFEANRMVKELVDATVEAEGALPLLQFVLAQLWEARDQARGIIPASALAASGGVNGALARHADEVLVGLAPEQRSAARRILVQLVTLEGTRARQTEKELGTESAHAQSALAALVRGRLLTATESPEGSAFEVTHEALIRSWPTLRRWLEEDSDRRILRDRLASAITEWQRLGHKREALWSSRQLVEAKILESAELLPREKVFLEASRRAVRARRTMWIASVVLAFFALVGTYFGMRLKAKRDLNAQVEAFIREGSSFLEQARAREAEVEALRNQAFTLFDQKQPETGEQVWARARLASSDVDGAYVRAGRALEAAMMFNNGSGRARRLLAAALYERAALADRDGRTGQRDELIARLPLYDDGSLQAKWLAPAKLTVEVIPSTARVILQRYQEREGQNPDLADDTLLPSTPIRELEKPPGSYLLTAIAPGMFNVRFPVLLRRGEARRIVLTLPRESDVPPGFVYVPAGPFLFGSLAETSLRANFFKAPPLHEASTEAFLIARHETTYGDWIDYLSALPSRERQKRTPFASGQMRGSVALEHIVGEWLLSLELGGKRYHLQVGEPLTLPERKTRQAQEWRNLPVGGITAGQAEAYVRWLDASGKVPGARICSEKEWEKAARGADGRDYPRGNHLDPGDANFDETYDRKPAAMGPDEVGSHPGSRSPFEIDDMSGNVWELTRSYASDGDYIARGGSYVFDRIVEMLSNRELVTPTFKDVSLGLRVCATVP